MHSTSIHVEKQLSTTENRCNISKRGVKDTPVIEMGKTNQGQHKSRAIQIKNNTNQSPPMRHWTKKKDRTTDHIL